jgi:hypothetical protein
VPPDVLAVLARDTLIDYIFDLQDEQASLRDTLHAALATITQQCVTIDRLEANQQRTVEAYRRLREQLLREAGVR